MADGEVLKALKFAIDNGLMGEQDMDNKPEGSPVPAQSNIIRVNDRFLRDITADAIQALQNANDPPSVFQRGTELVRMIDASLGAEQIVPAALKGLLDRSADFVKVKIDQESGEEIHLPARPPDDVVRDILTQQHLPFPVLRSFASTPVFLSGGRLLERNGYDPDSGIYLRLKGLDGLTSDMPLEEARTLLLDELLVDFPFADESSMAHAISALLLAFLRELISGPAPMHLIDAPTRGTGKGLLADLISVVTLGVQIDAMVLPRDEDEIDKRITATLMAGHPLILLDNVTVLRSSSLAAALTTTLWRGRLLGKSQMVNVPNTATWIATGNNVELSDEMSRRVSSIRLDAGVESPEERSGFKHSLPEWAIIHRTELVSACLSVINHWIKAGMPKGTATLGRFESWAGVMGGVLDVLGVSGFLGNRDQQKGRDTESLEWGALCEAWWERYQAQPVTAKVLLGEAKSQNILLALWGGRTDLGAQQRFGHALFRHTDRVFGKYQIHSAGNGSTGNRSYQLVRAEGQDKTPKTPETLPCDYEYGASAGGVLCRSMAKTPPKHGRFEAGDPENTPTKLSTHAGVFGVSGVSNPPLTDNESDHYPYGGDL